MDDSDDFDKTFLWLAPDYLRADNGLSAHTKLKTFGKRMKNSLILGGRGVEYLFFRRNYA